MNMNKSPFTGVQIDKRLIEANSILNTIHELKEYVSKFATLGSDIDYDFSDREVIIITEDDGKIRVDISDLSNDELDQLGTKMTVYIEFDNTYIESGTSIIDPSKIIDDKLESTTTTYSSYRINLLLNVIRELIKKLENDIEYLDKKIRELDKGPQETFAGSYNDLKDLPQINGITIKDNKTLADYGYLIATKTQGEDLFDEIWEAIE